MRGPIYFGTLAVMLFVLAAGAATRGSRRWIDVGFFTFQPSEFGKVLFVLALAGLRRRALALDARARGHRCAIIGYGLVPIVLVFVQPDIGTALVYAAALAAVLFIAGVRWLASRDPAALIAVRRARRALAAARGGRQRAQAVPGRSA